METAKANLLQAEVAGNRAEREYERLLKLKEFGLVTQQNLDEGLTEKEASAARIEAAKAQLKAAEEDIQHTQTRLSKTDHPLADGWGCFLPKRQRGRSGRRAGSQKRCSGSSTPEISGTNGDGSFRRDGMRSMWATL